MAKKIKPVRDFLEYAIFQTLRGMIHLVPRSCIPPVAHFMGDLSYYLDPRHRNVAEESIARVLHLPEGGPEARKIARSAFRHLARVAFEFVLTPKDLKDSRTGEEIFTLDYAERMEKILAMGKGAIMVTGHTGNWELMGAFISSRIAPTWVVSRPFRNPFMSRYLKARRSHFKEVMIPKKGALKGVVRALKEGHPVAFLVDQHAGSSEPKLDFMGIPAHTYVTPGTLAARLNVPIIPGFCYRVGPGFKYKAFLEEPIYPDPDRDLKEEAIRLTLKINQAIERFVRAHPEQWLWMHKRWR